MATRTALLNGNVINRDTDFSKHIEAVSEPWVISWFAVSSSSVAIWKAFVKCERSNGDIIYALVYNNSAQSISGDWDVYIEIPQELIDNWELANEDWSEIAEIKVGTMPAKNALKLATKSWNTITDARNMIKKSGELLALINQNIEDIEDLDERVEHLEEAGAIDHIEESGLVGELYEITSDLFLQKTPTLANSTLEYSVWNVVANKQVHIQRIWSGVASNQLKLKIKKSWSPTKNLIVEVRKWVVVNVNSLEAYRYWWELICSWSVNYSSVSTSFGEVTVTMNGNFGWTKWELLDIVLYQEDETVNSNCYVVAYDSTQISEWYSLVAVNWTTRSRTKLMPYCISDWLLPDIMSKVKTARWSVSENVTMTSTTASGDYVETTMFTATETWIYHFTIQVWNNTTQWSTQAQVTSWTVISWTRLAVCQNSETKNIDCMVQLSAWEALKVTTTYGSYWNWGARYWAATYERYADIPYMPNWEWLNYYIVKPRELKGLGQFIWWTLAGKHTDGTYYWWYMVWKSTSATVGNVTLWNAVGYITVNLNGEIVKIPYYWN